MVHDCFEQSHRLRKPISKDMALMFKIHDLNTTDSFQVVCLMDALWKKSNPIIFSVTANPHSLIQSQENTLTIVLADSEFHARYSNARKQIIKWANGSFSSQAHNQFVNVVDRLVSFFCSQALPSGCENSLKFDKFNRYTCYYQAGQNF